MEFILVVAIVMLLACVVGLMRQNDELVEENEFLKERWKKDIERDIQRTEREIARLNRL